MAVAEGLPELHRFTPHSPQTIIQSRGFLMYKIPQTCTLSAGGQVLLSLGETRLGQEQFSREPALEGTSERTFDKNWATAVLDQELTHLLKIHFECNCVAKTGLKGVNTANGFPGSSHFVESTAKKNPGTIMHLRTISFLTGLL